MPSQFLINGFAEDAIIGATTQRKPIKIAMTCYSLAGLTSALSLFTGPRPSFQAWQRHLMPSSLIGTILLPMAADKKKR